MRVLKLVCSLLLACGAMFAADLADQYKSVGDRLIRATVLAWTLRDNVSAVGYKYSEAVARGTPIMLFTPVPGGGWQFRAIHQVSRECRTLP